MRTSFLYCAFFIVSILFTSMAVSAQLQKIFLHPKAAGGEKQLEFVDSIRFIPLDVKEGVDLGEFNYVTVTRDFFLIINYPEKIVYLYSKKGTFEKKINYRNLADGFSPDYEEHTNQLVFFGDNKNYSLTQKDRVQISLDWQNPRNKKYFKKYRIDLADPAFSIQKGTPNENDILYANHYDGDSYWRGQIRTSPLYKDSLDYELKIYKDNKLIKGYFPYNRISEPRFLFTQENVSLEKTEVLNEHLLSRPYCDTIYRLSDKGISPLYKLVLPLENTLPASFYSQPFKNKTERENFRRNNGWMFHQVYNFYETERFIYFRVAYLSNYETYIYQKQSQLTYKTKNIKADTTQYDLPLLQDRGLQRKGDRFYKTTTAGELTAFFAKHKTIAVPKELEAFLATKPTTASPVIVEFKLKN